MRTSMSGAASWRDHDAGPRSSPTWLEPFWPSRRIVQFDELCRPAA